MTVPVLAGATSRLGDPLKIQLNFFSDSAGTVPRNLTTIGSSWLAELRGTAAQTTASATFSIDSSNAATGVLVLSLTAAQTAGLRAGTFHWDLKEITSDTTVVSGTYTPTGNYTHDAGTASPSASTPLNVGTVVGLGSVTAALTAYSVLSGTQGPAGPTGPTGPTGAVTYGTTAGTAAQGNDSRIVGATQKAANLSDVADAGTSRANLHVPMLVSCQAVATGNLTLSGTQTVDGYAAAVGDQILATGQSTASQNGPWVVASGAWTRPTDYATGASVKGRAIQVNGGAVYGGTVWLLTTTSTVVVDTSASAWAIANQGWLNSNYAPVVSPSLTGAPTVNGSPVLQSDSSQSFTVTQLAQMLANLAQPLSTVSISTDTTLTAGALNAVSAAAGNRSVTLPSGVAAGVRLVAYKSDTSLSTTVTISGTIRGSATARTLVWADESLELVSLGLNNWDVLAGHKTKTSLDKAYGNAENLLNWGAVGDGVQVYDGAMGVGGNVLTCATSAPFTAARVGQRVDVQAAGAPSTTLSAGLSTGGAITALPVGALAAALPAGQVVLFSAGTYQRFTTSGAASGATSIPVTSATPTVAFPSNTPVIAFAATLTTTITGFTDSGHVTLAASNASGVALSGMRVVFGTDDTAAIQACNSYLAARGGGKIIAPAKLGVKETVYLTTGVTLGTTAGGHVMLEGGGGHWGSVRLLLLAGAADNTHGVTNYVSTSTTQADAEYCGVSRITVDGNFEQQTAGLLSDCVYFNQFNTGSIISQGGTSPNENFDSHHRLEAPRLRGAARNGFYQQGNGETRLDAVYATECQQNGITPTYDSFMTQCTTSRNGYAGTVIQNSNVMAVGCKSWYNGRVVANLGAGFVMSNPNTSTLVGCIAQNNQAQGFYLNNARSAVLVGCGADSNNTGAGNAATKYAAVELYNSTNCRIDAAAIQNATGNSTGGSRGNQGTILRLRSNSTSNVITFTGQALTPYTLTQILTSDSYLGNNTLIVNGQNWSAPIATNTALVADGAVTFDCSQVGNGGTVVQPLSANATSSTVTLPAGTYSAPPPNPATGWTVTFVFAQDATGGRTYAWPANFLFNGTAPSGTTASTQFVVTMRFDGTNWQEVSRTGGSGSPTHAQVVQLGGPLAIVSYNPSTRATVSTTSSTSSDVDATNAVITFAAPPSGNVIVRVESDAAGSANGMTWNLRNASGDVAGTQTCIARTASVARLRATIYVTGLTAGTSYTWKLGQASIDNATSVTTRYGGTGSSLEGPLVLEVWAA